MIFGEKSFASTTTSNQLKIYSGPSSVPADNNMYNCIFVQLVDSSGKPVRASQSLTITLSSSLTDIGTVDPSIIINTGNTYVSANFYATYAPGTTTISATATGYSTVQTSITTIAPIPSAVAVYGFPSTLPADGNSYNAIMVQLQDSGGSPARAPKGGVQVTLTCSDTGDVGTVTPSNVIIPEGQTSISAAFTTTTMAQNKSYSETITATAQGYTSKQTTITTTPIASSPSFPTSPDQLKIFEGPTQIPADNKPYSQIVIELQNASGYTELAQSNIAVTLSSSDQSIGKIDSQLVIPTGQTFAVATFNTTYKAGSTTLTAVANNIPSAQQSISTVGFVPSKLAVYCVPSTLPADNATYQTIRVQLQDSQGRPAKDPVGNVSVSLFSSQPTVGQVSSTLTIPFGQTQATGALTTTNSPGTTTITAQASGYTTGQAQLTTDLIDFTPLIITVTTNPQNVNNGGQSTITAFVTTNGINPVTGATLTFTSDNGGTFAATQELGNGSYKTTFTAPSFLTTRTCTITATGSKTGYLDAQQTTQITIGSNSTSNGSNTETLIFHIEDSNGNPLNNTVVSSTAEPTGMNTLLDITNATGYVTFNNVTAGSYSFSITKDGYKTLNETINAPVSQLTFTLESSSAQSTKVPIIIVPVAIVVVVVAVVGYLFVIRRRNSTRTQKIKELQKQLNRSNSQIRKVGFTSLFYL